MNWTSARSMMQKSQVKYAFYEGKFTYTDFATSAIARKMSKSRVGWGKRAIEMRANKTHFDKFENDTIGLNEVFNQYKGGEAFNKLKEDILVCGVGFLGFLGERIMPFTALEATGEYDWYEQNLRFGTAILQETPERGSYNAERIPKTYVSYSRNSTEIFQDGVLAEYNNPTGRPLMGLLTHKSTTKQPLGRTVLIGPARDALIDGSRTVRQAMIAAYHYNQKVDVLLGIDSETDVDKVETSTGDVLKVGTNEEGQIPQIGQFAQHAMAPFHETLLISARNFCSDTKLNLSNLGISSNAPQSPEALEIVGDDLRDDITEWQKEVGEQLKYFAVTVWMFKNNMTSIDAALQKKIDAIETAWYPIFRADVSKFGDGLNKIAQNAPGIVKQRSIWRNLGLRSEEIDSVIESANRERDV
jgi:hypothetical protein